MVFEIILLFTTVMLGAFSLSQRRSISYLQEHLEIERRMVDRLRAENTALQWHANRCPPMFATMGPNPPTAVPTEEETK